MTFYGRFVRQKPNALPYSISLSYHHRLRNLHPFGCSSHHPGCNDTTHNQRSGDIAADIPQTLLQLTSAAAQRLLSRDQLYSCRQPAGSSRSRLRLVPLQTTAQSALLSLRCIPQRTSPYSEVTYSLKSAKRQSNLIQLH